MTGGTDSLTRISPEELARSQADIAFLSSVEDIIAEAKAGRMFILVDDEDRENEGDLVIPAEKADAAAIAFMARHGRGLICLSLTGDRVKELALPLMPRDNRQRQSTAFTVSIEAREGVTTGISAHDRARTIAVAIDPESASDDIVTPGHIFPLQARDGGVLVRAGHTEAAVDISRLAGLNPSGVICEIMNDDGTMARLPDLVKFAQFHGLKIGAIADLIAYRRRKERIVERVLETGLDSRYGGQFNMVIYRDKTSGQEHLALVKGDLTQPGPVLVRMHGTHILEDLLGDHGRGRGGELHKAMRTIGQAERGVVVVLREMGSLSQFSERVRAEANWFRGEEKPPLRDYGVGAHILLDLGVKQMILLSNTPRTIIALEGYDLEVIETRPIPTLD